MKVKFVAVLLLAACLGTTQDVRLPLLAQKPIDSEEVQNMFARMNAIYAVARTLFFDGDYEAAKKKFLETYEFSWRVAEAGGSPKFIEVNSLKYVGFCYQYQDDFDHALATFQQALKQEEQFKSAGRVGIGIADTLNDIGWVLYLKGDYAGALHYLQQALEASMLDPNYRITNRQVWVYGEFLRTWRLCMRPLECMGRRRRIFWPSLDLGRSKVT